MWIICTEFLQGIWEWVIAFINFEKQGEWSWKKWETQQAGEALYYGPSPKKMLVSLRERSETQNWLSGKLKARIFSFLPRDLLACYPCDLSHPSNYQYLSLWRYKSFRTSCSYLMYTLSRLLVKKKTHSMLDFTSESSWDM